MFVDVLSPSFLAFYWSSGFGRFLQVSTLASHWLKACAYLRHRRRETTNTAPITLSAVQAASQITFIDEQLYSTYD